MCTPKLHHASQQMSVYIYIYIYICICLQMIINTFSYARENLSIRRLLSPCEFWSNIWVLQIVASLKTHACTHTQHKTIRTKTRCFKTTQYQGFKCASSKCLCQNVTNTEINLSHKYTYVVPTSECASQIPS
jgi:hypothetical protein